MQHVEIISSPNCSQISGLHPTSPPSPSHVTSSKVLLILTWLFQVSSSLDASEQLVIELRRAKLSCAVTER